MQRCRHCGAESAIGARFCWNCGQVFTSAPNMGAAQDNRGEEEEKRRRGFMPPLPFPPQTPASGQVPMVQGAPTPGNVPMTEGIPPGNAWSAPQPSPRFSSGAPSSAPSTAPSMAPEQFFFSGTSGTAHWPSHPPSHEKKPGEPHHRHQHRHRVHRQHAVGTASKTAFGITTKWILIALVSLIVLAAGTSALVLAARLHWPGTGGTPPATGGNTHPISNAHGATATVCAGSTGGVSCASPTTSSSPLATGKPTGTFTFTGALAGTMVNPSFLACNLVNNVKDIVTVVEDTMNGVPYQLGFYTPYHGPGTYTATGINITVAYILRKSNGRGLANYGKLPLTITITGGGHAGTLDADLGDNATGTPAIGHVSGHWTCN